MNLNTGRQRKLGDFMVAHANHQTLAILGGLVLVLSYLGLSNRTHLIFLAVQFSFFSFFFGWFIIVVLIFDRLMDEICIEEALEFVVSLQQPDGGVAPREGDASDLFHTQFAVAAACMFLPYGKIEEINIQYEPCDPRTCLPKYVLNHVG
eukprot:m.80284 g.80284  ORF g.80284 m.80284 type:complete len:150 (-) comp8620_c0_seq15:1406-1855(-)